MLRRGVTDSGPTRREGMQDGFRHATRVEPLAAASLYDSSHTLVEGLSVIRAVIPADGALGFVPDGRGDGRRRHHDNSDSIKGEFAAHHVRQSLKGMLGGNIGSGEGL